MNPLTNPFWRSGLQRVGRASGSAWQRLICGLANLRRRLFRQRLPDYVVFTLNQTLAERPPVTPWWYDYIPGLKAPMSLAELSQSLERIAGDPAIKGVLFLARGASLGLAQAQNLAQLLARFRQWDQQYHPNATHPKRIIFHVEQITGALYVVACAADQIAITPLTSWDVLGLRTTPTFWKTTLEQLGITMDVVKIAPWKTAADQLSEATMTQEFREQMEWLFDSLYGDLVQAIHVGRRLPVETVKELIDGGPWVAEAAKAYGLVDAIAYEDELPALLGTPEIPARLQWYAKLRGLLLRHPHRHHPQAIGVISLTGAIVPGESRSFPLPLPLFGDDVLGHLTAQQQIRAAQQDDQLAAVVVHVDSRGGSALASDLIWRELKQLDQEKPVVVYMGDVAASGGYYIATPGRKIVAQSATLTGSIGVITAKPVLQESYHKLQAKRYAIQRGAHAGLYHDDQPWDDEQRQKVVESVQHIYQAFTQRVAASRQLDAATLDRICNGRVWTGRQALEVGLVDSLGDFATAVTLACEVAGLPTDGSVAVRDLTPPKQRLLAETVRAVNSWLGQTRHPLPTPLALTLFSGLWLQLFNQDHHWLIAPELPTPE